MLLHDYSKLTKLLFFMPPKNSLFFANCSTYKQQYQSFALRKQYIISAQWQGALKNC